MAFKGTHDVKPHGSKVWRQRLKVAVRQKVSGGAILVMNAKNLKAGENTYQRKNNIHAQISGKVEIKDRRISVRASGQQK